jgi:DNA polymerase-1
MAINAPIQGTAADIIKKAMVEIDEYLAKEKLEEDVHMLLQVHDELIFEIKKDCLERCSKRILDIMRNVISKDETKGVPIEAEGSAGPNWDSLVSFP